MSWMGKEVQHFQWGKGAVRAQRHGGYELLVKFDNGIITWIRKNDLTLISNLSQGTITLNPSITSPIEPADITESGPQVQISEGSQIKRQAIEAFRLGIVPSFVKDFIFGREKEIKYIDDWLDQETQNFILLFGDYGSGKSHFLRYIQEMALENEYAVARCTLDPEESPLYKPKMVYRNIVSNFMFNDGKGFREFILKISDNNSKKSTDNQFVNYIMQYSKNDELFWRWLEADDIIKTIHGFPTLHPWGTAANIFCNLLTVFGYYARETLGLRGILLLFDEAESLNFPSLYSYQYSKGKNFFRGLLLAASNDSRLLTERKSVATPITGQETDLIYCGRNQIQYLYRSPSGIKVIFALTPSDEIKQFCVDIGYDKYLPLEQLTLKNKEEVIDALFRTYIEAYPDFVFSDSDLKIIKKVALEIGQNNIRGLIKCTIEAMDLRRHWYTKSIGELLV